MLIVITTISILAITCLVLLANRILPFKICPICVGVSGTWLWILFGIYIGLLEAESWKLVAAIAMGGSVVGIAYQIEKRLPPNRSLLLWKMLFIPAGFAAAYGILSYRRDTFFAAVIFLVILTLYFIEKPRRRPSNEKKLEELENKMKQCC